MKKIAILGATGYIGKSISQIFIESGGFNLSLFSRDKNKLINFVGSLAVSNNTNYTIGEIGDFSNDDYDIVLNCTGIGNPNFLKQNPWEIFKTTESIDDLIISKIENKKDTVYINLSSGAVFGLNAAKLMNFDTKATFNPNGLDGSSYYSIAKLNSEAKHRSRGDLNIIDLRIFSFFSRYINLDSGFLMSDIINSVKLKSAFKTTPVDIVRDYVCSNDLYDLILLVINGEKHNGVYDVYSKKPISKFDILELFKTKYGLDYEVSDEEKVSSPTGEKNEYYSSNYSAGSKLGYEPKFTSLEGIESEIEYIIG